MFKKFLLYSSLLSSLSMCALPIAHAIEKQPLTVESKNESAIINCKEWEKAKKHGYSKAQFDKIMAIPKQHVSSVLNTREILTQQQASVVNTAKKYLGTPYLWGGSTPAGFDCSGLVQYVYKEAVGISLPRVTTGQETCGKSISLNSLKPGDLLFWGEIGSSYHVAIYIGNGQYIHAPQPGQNVQYGNIQSWKPNFARRVLPESDPKPISCNQFITVTKNNANCYTDSSLSKIKQSSNNIYQKTLHAENYVTDSNNKKYYALYDKDKQFQGYLSEDALKISNHEEAGIFFKDDYYIKVQPKSNGAKIWKDLKFKEYFDSAQNHIGEVYHVKGHYNHFNQYTYLSLYNSDDEWCGYVNQLDSVETDSVLNEYHSYRKYATITKSGFNIYQDTLLKTPISTTDKYMNCTVFARGYYDAFDKKRYLSIFEEDPTDTTDGLKWIGYVDANALTLGQNNGDSKGGIAFPQKENTLISIAKPDYSIWKDLNFNQKLNVAQEGTWYELKNKYHDFNNYWYGEIYDVNRQTGERTFVGYINMNALQIEDNNFGEYHSLRKNVTVAKKETKYGLYNDKSLSSNSMIDNSLNMVGKTYYAQGYYDRIPTKDNKRGGRFYSIRESKDGKWLGYMRSTAFNPLN